jgi:hypothetical protein
MFGSKLITANEVDDVQVCGEGAPKWFVLRGNAKCESLLDTLEHSGVTFFRCLCRTRDGQTGDDFPAMLDFEKGIRLSSSRYEDIKHTASLVSRVISDAVIEAVEQTSAEGQELLIEAAVSLTAPRGIHAAVTVFYPSDPDFTDRKIPLL